MPNRPDPDTVVRPMEEADLDAAFAMFAAVAGEGRWVGTESSADWDKRRARWKSSLTDPAQCTYVAVTADGAVVGSANLSLTEYGVAEVGMAVAAGWRGRGVGGLLLDALIEGAEALGAHKLALQVWPHNARALALYRSRGFAEEGRLQRHYRRSSGELWDAIVMGLLLDTASPGSPFGDEPLLA